VTAPLAILVDMLSFLVSATLVGRIRVEERSPERSTCTAVWTSAAEGGLRFALGNPFLRAVTITAALSNLCANVVAALYILYATRELGITPVGLGLIATALSIGTVLGAIVAGRVTARYGLGPTFLGAAVLIVLGSAATPAAGLVPGAALAMLVTGQAVVGLTLPLFNVNISSIRQGVMPDRLLRRASSGITFFTGGAMPVGALLGGALGDSEGSGRRSSSVCR
jgi:Na+/melibiose symporter-like transporter